MTGIVEFIRARLDEWEELARAADVKQGDPSWQVSPAVGLTIEGRCTVRSARDSRPIARVEQLDGDDDEPAAILDARAVGEHIAAHDPASVLRQVEALRALVAFCDDDPLTHDGGWAYTDRVLEYVASIWADHPAYDEAWRPE